MYYATFLFTPHFFLHLIGNEFVPEHVKTYDTTWSQGAMAIDDISCVIFPLAYFLIVLVMSLENPGIYG